MENLNISRLDLDGVREAVEWARLEGWNPGINDAQAFFVADPAGFFGGFLDDELVVVGSTVAYDESYAFAGLYIARPDMRQRGFGMALTNSMIEYGGDRTIGIDGVLENEALYQRIGFETHHENVRYQFAASDSGGAADVVSYRIDHRLGVDQLDRECFPAQRKAFLDAWLSMPDSLALVCERDGEIAGYAVRRVCAQGHKIGPVFARDAPTAAALVQSCQVEIDGEMVMLDVPDDNPSAVALAESLHGDVVFATKRMYRNGSPQLASGQVYGITTFELG